MISVNAIKRMLERLGFSEAAATYLIATCGIDSLGEIACLHGSEDVDAMIKSVTSRKEQSQQEKALQELLHVTMEYLYP
jgi:hypothetical protein